ARGVDVQFRRLGRKFHPRLAAGKFVYKPRHWRVIVARGTVGILDVVAPDTPENGPLDRSRRQIVGAKRLSVGRDALGFTANAVGDGEGDGGEGCGKPQHDEQRSAFFGFSRASWGR